MYARRLSYFLASFYMLEQKRMNGGNLLRLEKCLLFIRNGPKKNSTFFTFFLSTALEYKDVLLNRYSEGRQSILFTLKSYQIHTEYQVKCEGLAEEPRITYVRLVGCVGVILP